MASGSDLINAGVTSTGITYNGSAPDLGAIESGNTSTSYSLTTNISPAAGGTVSRSPNATTYAPGTVVTLTATPSSGYTFTGWSGDVTGSSTSVTVTMNANKTVTASFTNGSGTTYTLTTTVSPAAGGTITRSPNATSYAAGTVVTLTATPASGYVFSNWSGGAGGTGTTTSITMNANTSVTANFTTSGGGTGTTLRIDDKSGTGTGYCSANGSRQNTYSGADGGYYINLSNSSGQGITWAVSAGAAGTYNLVWRYANAGSQSATTARVLVNGVQVNGAVSFPKTAAWTTWTTTTAIPVTLVAGANKIRLETTVSSEFANIDWIEITGNNPAEASCSAATGGRMATEGDAATLVVESAPIVVPNPTTGLSTVRFTLATQQKVIINLFAADGRLVSTLANRTFLAGTHTIPVDYKGMQKGVYFISINYNGKQKLLQNILSR